MGVPRHRHGNTEFIRRPDTFDYVPDRSEVALNHLIGACNIRALGDVQNASMSWQDWLKRLERACKRELKRQGKEAWQSKRRRERGQELERHKKTARAHAIRAKRAE